MKPLARLRATLLGVLATSPAFAQGYFSGVQGARASGRAGAFTARADDLSAVELNPAGLTHIDGTVIQVGNRFMYNGYAYTRAPTLDWGHPDSQGVPPQVTFATVHNEKPWQYLDPIVGVASHLGQRDWAFALAAYGAPGISQVQFPVDGGQRYMMVRREAQILYYTASAAWKYHETFGLGASLQWIAVPRLSYQLIIDGNTLSRAANPVWSEVDMRTTVTGSDPFTLNAVVGAWYRPRPFLEWGLSAQVIPSQIHVKGHLAVEPLSSDITDKVALKRNGESADDVTLSLPLPITVREGVRYRHLKGGREVFDVEVDVTYEFWSRVKEFSVNTDGLVAYLMAQRVPIGQIDIQKHWRNTVGIALGGDYRLIENVLSVRGGVSYLSAVSDPGYANVDFVSGQQLGAAVGASMFVHGFELALAYGYTYQPPLSVSENDSRFYQAAPASQCRPPYTDSRTCNVHYLGIPAPPVNAGTYSAYSNVAALDILYRF